MQTTDEHCGSRWSIEWFGCRVLQWPDVTLGKLIYSTANTSG